MYLLHSLPSRSGVGDILNHSWKKRLRVGVMTSINMSLVKPFARSLRKGNNSLTLSAATESDVAFEVLDDVSGSPLLVEAETGVRARRIGRNSAGPVGLLSLDQLCQRSTLALRAVETLSDPLKSFRNRRQ